MVGSGGHQTLRIRCPTLSRLLTNARSARAVGRWARVKAPTCLGGASASPARVRKHRGRTSTERGKPRPGEPEAAKSNPSARAPRSWPGCQWCPCHPSCLPLDDRWALRHRHWQVGRASARSPSWLSRRGLRCLYGGSVIWPRLWHHQDGGSDACALLTLLGR